MVDPGRAVPDQAERGNWRFIVAVRLKSDGPIVDREPVRPTDFADADSELWLTSHLQLGHLDTPPDALTIRRSPIFRNNGSTGGVCDGFWLRTVGPAGRDAELDFSIHALDRVAARVSKRLQARGRLKAGESYYYSVLAEPDGASPAEPADADARLCIRVTRAPLNWLSTPLAPLHRRARAMGPVRDCHFSVFYTAEALKRAERFSRRGAGSRPPIETGAALVGPICRCPVSGRIFQVICDALELSGVEEREYSLTWSGATWQRVQADLDSLRRQPGAECWRQLGQVHGHNFLPADLDTAGKALAAGGPGWPGSDSAFVSLDDRDWHSAVFSGQPWAICHIFGHLANGARVDRLYGLEDARLLERGYYLIDRFEPADAESSADGKKGRT